MMIDKYSKYSLLSLLILHFIPGSIFAENDVIAFKAKRQCGSSGIEITFDYDPHKSVVTNFMKKDYCINENGKWKIVVISARPINFAVSNDATFTYQDANGNSIQGKVKNNKAINGTIRSRLQPLCVKTEDFKMCRTWEATPVE